MTPEEKKTIESYDAHAKTWSEKHSDLAPLAGMRSRFFELVSGNKILEIGSGGGRDAKEFIKNGYDYTGMDVSKELLSLAQKDNPKGNFMLQDLYSVNSDLTGRFDGLWCAATLLHIPRSRLAEVLSNIKSYLRDDGVLFVSFKKGVGSEVESRDIGGVEIGRFFEYYSEDEVKDFVVGAGFEIISIELGKFDNRSSWIYCFAKNVK